MYKARSPPHTPGVGSGSGSGSGSRVRVRVRVRASVRVRVRARVTVRVRVRARIAHAASEAALHPAPCTHAEAGRMGGEGGAHGR